MGHLHDFLLKRAQTGVDGGGEAGDLPEFGFESGGEDYPLTMSGQDGGPGKTRLAMSSG